MMKEGHILQGGGGDFVARSRAKMNVMKPEWVSMPRSFPNVSDK